MDVSKRDAKVCVRVAGAGRRKTAESVRTWASTTNALLAGELARQPDHRAAFAAYEGRMRPYVSEAQKLPPGAPRLSSPRSRTGIRLYHAALRAAASPMVGRLAQRFSASSGEKFVLPEYAPH
jgi:hypothetical protein